MDREEFRRTVKKMQDEGVPLSMANLMVRTELPRATIESWLDEMQRDIKDVLPPPPKPAVRADGDGDGEASDGGIVDRAKALKRELLSEAVKSQLGVGNARASGKPRRDVKLGGILGLVLPPAGLLYAAPMKIAITGTVAYLALSVVAWKLLFLGGFYLISLMHVAGAVLGVGYAWRFNRKGKRTNLLPGGGSKRTEG